MLTRVPFPAVALILCASLAMGFTFSTERPSRTMMQADQWSLIGLGSVNITDIALDNSNSNTIYVSSSTVGVGVYKSVDGGESWQTMKTGLPSNVSVTDVAVDPTNPSVLYATSEEVGTSLDGAIYKSANGGEAWAKVQMGWISSASRSTLRTLKYFMP